jgi:hypothetical protein
VDKDQNEAHFRVMADTSFPARSPADKVGGLVHFGRMLDKIRAHTQGALPVAYVPNLGKGFDGRCVRFLGVKYEEIAEKLKHETMFQFIDVDEGRTPRLSS